MDDTRTYEQKKQDIRDDPTLNRHGRRMFIAKLDREPSDAKKERARDHQDNQKAQIAGRVARKVEKARARKAAIEKAKQPTKMQLLKRKVYEMRMAAKDIHALRFKRKMQRTAAVAN